MTFREQITNLCLTNGVVVTPDENLIETVPGVYLFTGYDKQSKTIKRFEGVDLGASVRLVCL